ncbi:Uncharacterised protein [Corynebacterium renale]|nr:Uncharacterised protein [Corynebacterium renale]
MRVLHGLVYGVTMRIPTTILAGLTALTLAGCSAGEEAAPTSTPTPTPQETTMNTAAEVPILGLGVGYETVRDPDIDTTALRERLDQTGATAVAVSVGRPEFLAAPLEGMEEHWAPSARRAAEEGEDQVAHMVEELAGGTSREVTLTLDVLAPLLVDADTDSSMTGYFADGQRSESFPSATALSGSYGDVIARTCAGVASRYQPDRIALTELIGEAFFSEADEQLFAQASGREGFPRTPDGEVDTADPQVVAWHSDVISGVVSGCVDAAAPHGVAVDMDVRVNWDNPGADRADSGHRYDELLATGATLTLWAYTGTGDVPASKVADIVRGLQERYDAETLQRITVSLGLWGDGDSVISPEEFSVSLDAFAEASNGELGLLVTPASLFDDAHWKALADHSAEHSAEHGK